MADIAAVDDRIGIIAQALDKADFAQNVSGLKELLDDYLNPDIETTKFDFYCGLL